MLTDNIGNQVDRIWDAFWSGGIPNPLEVTEQVTYLLFLSRLDDLQILKENKPARLKTSPTAATCGARSQDLSL
jgi:type I restriction enzyme M protein